MPAIRINPFKFSRSIVHNNLVHPTAFFGGRRAVGFAAVPIPASPRASPPENASAIGNFSEGELDAELERPAAADPVHAAAAAERTSHVAEGGTGERTLRIAERRRVGDVEGLPTQ